VAIVERTDAGTPDQEWLTPGVRGIGLASLLADLGHEIPTALLPSLLGNANKQRRAMRPADPAAAAILGCQNAEAQPAAPVEPR
jgi:hypothetical protein